MMKKELDFGIVRAAVSAPENADLLLFIVDELQSCDTFSAVAARYNTGAAVLEVADWDKYLSPWCAKTVFKRSPDFSGCADELLSAIANRVVPEIEDTLGIHPARRGIGGYSLAGLFALYSFWRTDIFDCGFSASGSMWFDGFAEYICKNVPMRAPEVFCFSLGDTEDVSRSPRIATVGMNTELIVARLNALGTRTSFHYNRGGHFCEENGRICDLIERLCGRVCGESNIVL